MHGTVPLHRKPCLPTSGRTFDPRDSGKAHHGVCSANRRGFVAEVEGVIEELSLNIGITRCMLAIGRVQGWPEVSCSADHTS